MSDSIVSLADAEAYFASRLHTSLWDSADESAKLKALSMASISLSSKSFQGFRTVQDQPLAWPRSDVPVNDRFGSFYPSNVTPADVKNAVCELALSLLKSDTVSTAQILSKQVGDLKIQYADTNRPTSETDGLPSTVYQMLKPFLRSSTSIRLQP